MNEILFTSEELGAPLKFLTSLAIGLLLGLQRERTPSAKAGLRTFALVALFGTASGLIADAAESAWIIAASLMLVGLMIIAAYRHEGDRTEVDSGTTTVIAVLLCFGLGVMVWYDRSQLAVAVAIVATVLLQFKSELHGFSERLSQQDLASILQFAVLTFIVLPLLPDKGYDPYRVLNPHHIWLMVVLVSGVSLAGYLALRLAGPGKSLLLVGTFGGLVSSTATTLVYAREGRAQPELAPIGSVIIAIANLVVLARFAVIGAVVAPGVVHVMLPVPGVRAGAGRGSVVQPTADRDDLAGTQGPGRQQSHPAPGGARVRGDLRDRARRTRPGSPSAPAARDCTRSRSCRGSWTWTRSRCRASISSRAAGSPPRSRSPQSGSRTWRPSRSSWRSFWSSAVSTC